MVAVQIIIAVIPIVGIVMGSVLVFFYFLWRQLTVIGSVLFGLFYLIAGVGYILLGGLIPLALGISLILFYAITHRSWNKEGQKFAALPEGKTEG